MFQQGLEPSGEYMVSKPTGFEPVKDKYNNWVSGEITFKNPLVIEWGEYGDRGWKKLLSDKYGKGHLNLDTGEFISNPSS